MRRPLIAALAAALTLTLTAAACGGDGGATDLSSTAADATVPTVGDGDVGSGSTVSGPASPDTTAPIRSTTTTAPAGPPRVFVVGDSTLLAVEAYERLDVFGEGYVYDAESCRTVGVPSCAVPPPAPPNVVETIEGAEGPFDVVVVMAGYDEWWTSFPASFDAAVGAARAKGASRIVWLTYAESPVYKGLSRSPLTEALTKNNQTLRDKVASGGFDDVTLADWDTYVADHADWLEPDGIHLTYAGAIGVADYIQRQVAFLTGQPCPAPEVPGGAVADPCPDPATAEPIADVLALYR